MTDVLAPAASYRALQRLSDTADETLAQVGETCARVPVASLPGLLSIGAITLATASPIPKAKG